MFLVLFLVFTT